MSKMLLVVWTVAVLVAVAAGPAMAQSPYDGLPQDRSYDQKRLDQEAYEREHGANDWEYERVRKDEQYATDHPDTVTLQAIAAEQRRLAASLKGRVEGLENPSNSPYGEQSRFGGKKAPGGTGMLQITPEAAVGLLIVGGLVWLCINGLVANARAAQAAAAPAAAPPAPPAANPDIQTAAGAGLVTGSLFAGVYDAARVAVTGPNGFALTAGGDRLARPAPTVNNTQLTAALQGALQNLLPAATTTTPPVVNQPVTIPANVQTLIDAALVALNPALPTSDANRQAVYTAFVSGGFDPAAPVPADINGIVGRLQARGMIS